MNHPRQPDEGLGTRRPLGETRTTFAILAGLLLHQRAHALVDGLARIAQGCAAAMQAASAGVCVQPQLPSSCRAHVAVW